MKPVRENVLEEYTSRGLRKNKSGKLVANIHLGTERTSDRYLWAEAGILRRNAIRRMKFHCQDFSFIDEFSHCKNWDFLDPHWKPNPDPLGYTDQSKKPSSIRNPQPAVPLDFLQKSGKGGKGKGKRSICYTFSL